MATLTETDNPSTANPGNSDPSPPRYHNMDKTYPSRNLQNIRSFSPLHQYLDDQAKFHSSSEEGEPHTFQGMVDRYIKNARQPSPEGYLPRSTLANTSFTQGEPQVSWQFPMVSTYAVPTIPPTPVSKPPE